MPRIRSLKPEFPQSESMGRVSRDARLLFVQLWTLCDDHGRTRASSRMLASLLFPYDDDAPEAIPGWLDALEREGCIYRYQGDDGTHYLEVCNWAKHQRIDHPGKPLFPAPREASRKLASPRESSCLDQGSGIKDQGPRISTSRPKRARESVPDTFLRFWDAFGKRGSRKEALLAWNRVAPDDALAETIIAKASEYRAACPDPAYQRHGCRWLKGECWNDAVQQPMAAAGRLMPKAVPADYYADSDNPVQVL